MKMTDQDYEILKTAIDILSKDIVHRHYEFLVTNYTTGNVDRRFRWDLLWASKVDLRRLENDLLDCHIDTALKKIVKELNLTGDSNV
jgi:hypothetical protein